jgi:hypothetical protein
VFGLAGGQQAAAGPTVGGKLAMTMMKNNIEAGHSNEHFLECTES